MGGAVDGEAAQAGVVQADLGDGLDVEVGDEEGFLEHGGGRDEVATGVVDHAAAREDEGVLPADQVVVADDDGVVGGAGGEHLFARGDLAGVEGRAVDVDHHLGAGQGLLLDGAGGVPDILADADAHGDAGDLEDRGLAAGPEIAALVEDAVVGQELLVVDAGAPAVVEDGGGVVGVGGEVDEADECGDVLAGGGGLEILKSGEIVVDEGAAEEEVLGGVAGEGEFREGDEVAGEGLSAVDGVADEGGVALEVADGGVDLSEGNAQGAHDSLRDFVSP